MAIEQLLNNPINARDFHPPAEARPKGWIEQVYEDLKETPLYNNEKNYWKDHMEGKTYQSDIQLMSLLTESTFDKKNIKEKYEKLKDQFYNKEKGHWAHSASYPDSYAFVQLFAILVEGTFDKESALQNYNALKQTSHYNETSGRWKEEKKDENFISLTSQFLGVLVEQMYDENTAREKYEKLKQIPKFYDKEKEEWKPINASSDCREQLLAVLIEKRFDKKEGKKKFERLKNTKFYNKKRGVWNCFWNDSSIYTQDQLLGLFVEAELEEEPETITPEKEVPVPEVRIF